MNGLEIKLDDKTSVNSVANWLRDQRGVTFVFTRKSGFGLFGEGVSLGVLKAYKTTGRECAIKTKFAIEAQDASSPDLSGPFQSLFGISAAYAASQVIDSKGDQSRQPLLRALWSFVQNSQGEFGDGKRRYVVFRDPDYSIPQCLRVGSQTSFPDPSDFRALIRRMWRSLTGDPTTGLPDSETQLITFLYETVKNSDEHGHHSTTNETIRGIRGIIAEKYIFGPAQKSEFRKGIPQPVSAYLQRIAKAERTKGQVIVAFTVSDVGLGIQNTLPSLPGESPWQRLNRAFIDGESRKPKGTDLQRGLGLSKVWRAAAKLKAFLFVSSAELIGYRDYSIVKQSETENIAPILTPAGKIPGRVGTSISLLWSASPK